MKTGTAGKKDYTSALIIAMRGNARDVLRRPVHKDKAPSQSDINATVRHDTYMALGRVSKAVRKGIGDSETTSYVRDVNKMLSSVEDNSELDDSQKEGAYIDIIKDTDIPLSDMIITKLIQKNGSSLHKAVIDTNRHITSEAWKHMFSQGDADVQEKLCKDARPIDTSCINHIQDNSNEEGLEEHMSAIACSDRPLTEQQWDMFEDYPCALAGSSRDMNSCQLDKLLALNDPNVITNLIDNDSLDIDIAIKAIDYMEDNIDKIKEKKFSEIVAEANAIGDRMDDLSERDVFNNEMREEFIVDSQESAQDTYFSDDVRAQRQARRVKLEGMKNGFGHFSKYAAALRAPKYKRLEGMYTY